MPLLQYPSKNKLQKVEIPLDEEIEQINSEVLKPHKSSSPQPPPEANDILLDIPPAEAAELEARAKKEAEVKHRIEEGYRELDQEVVGKLSLTGQRQEQFVQFIEDPNGPHYYWLREIDHLPKFRADHPSFFERISKLNRFGHAIWKRMPTGEFRLSFASRDISPSFAHGKMVLHLPDSTEVNHDLVGMVSKHSDITWDVLGRLFKGKTFYYPGSGLDTGIIRNSKNTKLIMHDPFLKDKVSLERIMPDTGEKEGIIIPKHRLKDVKIVPTAVEYPFDGKKLAKEIGRNKVEVIISKCNHVLKNENVADFLRALEEGVLKKNRRTFFVDFSYLDPHHLAEAGYYPVKLGPNLKRLSESLFDYRIGEHLHVEPAMWGSVAYPISEFPTIYVKEHEHPLRKALDRLKHLRKR